MNTRKGFTLVELLVVIAILAILATVSVVGYTSFIDRANQSTALQEMTQIRDSILAEDILNPNFSFDADGKIEILTSSDAGYNAAYDDFNTFIGKVVAQLGTGRSCATVADGATTLVLTNTDKNVKATLTFKTGAIVTEKVS